jgi:hypothetical protein
MVLKAGQRRALHQDADVGGQRRQADGEAEDQLQQDAGGASAI